ncbi:unnamed protein product [Mucor fragilis]
MIGQANGNGRLHCFERSLYILREALKLQIVAFFLSSLIPAIQHYKMSHFIQYNHSSNHMPCMREPVHHTDSIYSNCSSTSTLSNHLDAASNHKTDTLKWFFKAVSAVDNSCKATTENLNKLVSFYL